MKYDIFNHPAGTRVRDTRTGKSGVIVAVVTTGYEWIEPKIQWDDGKVEIWHATNLEVVDEEEETDEEA